MDVLFRALINKSVGVYLDDVTVLYKDKKDHVNHLRHIFTRCGKYFISLNPKKYFFAVNEGNILGFVVSKYGIMIKPKWIEVISNITFLHNNKSMWSFLNKINFVRRFVPSFVETIKQLQDMIKKDVDFKWGSKERESFIKIREEITKALALLGPNFSQNFILYIFMSNTSFTTILTQKRRGMNSQFIL